MKTKTTTKQKALGVMLSTLTFLGVMIIETTAHAATIFLDDFEDGDASGWATSSAGSGSTGVVFNNESMRAFASQVGTGSTALSRDFDYGSDLLLSFDMQVIANTGISPVGGLLNASGGVTVSFLSQFNVGLGSVTFAHSTSGSVPTDWLFIDETINNFSGSMLEFAGLAGLDDSSGISILSLDFFSTAATSPYGDASSNSIVYFDNVSISTSTPTIPIPAAIWLFGSGLIGLIGVARRKNV